MVAGTIGILIIIAVPSFRYATASQDSQTVGAELYAVLYWTGRPVSTGLHLLNPATFV